MGETPRLRWLSISHLKAATSLVCSALYQQTTSIAKFSLDLWVDLLLLQFRRLPRAF